MGGLARIRFSGGNLKADVLSPRTLIPNSLKDQCKIPFPDPLQEEGIRTTQKEFLLGGGHGFQGFDPHPKLAGRYPTLQGFFNGLPS